MSSKKIYEFHRYQKDNVNYNQDSVALLNDTLVHILFELKSIKETLEVISDDMDGK